MHTALHLLLAWNVRRMTETVDVRYSRVCVRVQIYNNHELVTLRETGVSNSNPIAGRANLPRHAIVRKRMRAKIRASLRAFSKSLGVKSYRTDECI